MNDRWRYVDESRPTGPSWRERVAAARERGVFTPADYADAVSNERCCIGEARWKLAEVLGDVSRLGRWTTAYDLLRSDARQHDEVNMMFPVFVNANSFASAERCCDVADDLLDAAKRRIGGAS